MGGASLGRPWDPPASLSSDSLRGARRDRGCVEHGALHTGQAHGTPAHPQAHPRLGVCSQRRWCQEAVNRRALSFLRPGQ